MVSGFFFLGWNPRILIHHSGFSGIVPFSMYKDTILVASHLWRWICLRVLIDFFAWSAISGLFLAAQLLDIVGGTLPDE